jgi:hypothetical protein
LGRRHSAEANAFAHFAERQVNALIIAADVFLNGKAEKIVALATHHAFPTIGNQRVLAAAGSLLG